MRKAILFTSLASFLFGMSIQAQLLIDDGISAFDAVSNILVGDGTEVLNISFSGDGNQLGAFTGNSPSFLLDSGVILATGSVLGAIGPNNTSSLTEGGGNIGAGDPDLQLISGTEMQDASILEFDFVASSDSLVLEYVFASEEYNEYVCSEFNDVFGIFLSGPGITGPFSNNSKNLALIPGTNVEVAVNTVNNGMPGIFGQDSLCSAIDSNWAEYAIYFVDNSEITGGTEMQYDGFTVDLQARAVLECGETYHLKIAIADAVDDQFDSALFLKRESIQSQSMTNSFVLDDSPAGHPQNCLVEGCIGGQLIINRPNTDSEQNIGINLSGDANPGADYSNIPSEISFPLGQSVLVIDLIALTDQEIEPNELITLTYTYQNTCGTQAEVSTDITIIDYQNIALDLPETMSSCPDSDTILEVTPIGGLAPYQYEWNGVAGSSVFTANNTSQVNLTVSDFCGNNSQASAQIVLSEPLFVDFPAGGCNEDVLSFEITGGAWPFNWEWDAATDVEMIDDVSFQFFTPGNFTADLVDACGQSQIVSVEIKDCSLVVPNVFSPNNDGVNDYFRILGLEEFPNSRLTINNRWGNVVFKSDNYLNNWDGYGVEEGTYYVILELSDGQELLGILSIMR